MSWLSNLFKSNKEEKKQPAKKTQRRSLVGGRRSRYTDWINDSLVKVNADINEDYLETIKKCRSLAKNEPIIRAYLGACVKNIIGKTGFTLQCQLKKSESELDEKFNDKIEWAWYDFGKTSNGFLTVDGGMGHNEFDALILRTIRK